MSPKFLVTGATGHQGGATARVLLSQNAIVHAFVRDLSSAASQALKDAGAVLFKGDFDDVSAIEAATAGVTGVFLNPYPTRDPADQIRHGQNFVNAAVASKTVQTIVVSTVFRTGKHEIWANDKDGLYGYYASKRAVEEAVRSSGLKYYTILRPAWLMYNYLLPALPWHYPELASEGVLAHSNDAGARIPQFDALDVGKFAAAALLDPERFNGEEIELGNENLSIEEVGKVISEVVGREIVVRKRSDEELTAVADKIVTLEFQLLANAQRLDIDGETLQEKYGIKLATLKEYLEREKDTLLKSLPN